MHRLKRPKDEMKFRKMIPATAGAQPISTISCPSLHTVDRKLTISEMQSLTEGRSMFIQVRYLYAVC